MKLSGSTLLETLVATILFLLVFSIAIETIVRINKMRNVDWISMELEFNRERESGVPIRDTSLAYPWGTMHWEVASDDEFPELKAYTVTACMKNGQKAVYHFIKD